MNSRERAWATAFLNEASDNLYACKHLANNIESHPSTCAMLIQMTFEKISKSYLLSISQTTIDSMQASHVAISQAFGHIRRDISARQDLGIQNNKTWNPSLALLNELERAHPSLAPQGSAQLEYPWEDPVSGEVRWPAAHLALLERLCDPQLRHVHRLCHLATSFLRWMRLRLGEEG